MGMRPQSVTSMKTLSANTIRSKGPGYLSGVLGSIWFMKLQPFIGAFGV